MIYSISKTIIYIQLEKMHRYAFDNLYKQDYIITFKDKVFLRIYYMICGLFPGFRSYLKKYKPILTRGYNMKKLSIINTLIYLEIRKINTNRYS